MLVVFMVFLKFNMLSSVLKVIFVVSIYGEGEFFDVGRIFSKVLKKVLLN